MREGERGREGGGERGRERKRGGGRERESICVLPETLALLRCAPSFKESLSIKYGTCTTVKADIWNWLGGRTCLIVVRCFFFARNRGARFRGEDLAKQGSTSETEQHYQIGRHSLFIKLNDSFKLLSTILIALSFIGTPSIDHQGGRLGLSRSICDHKLVQVKIFSAPKLMSVYQTDNMPTCLKSAHQA